MVDTQSRPLTIEPSKTNAAHEMWYHTMTWVERGQVLDRPEIARIKSPLRRLRAAINWVEDNLIKEN